MISGVFDGSVAAKRRRKTNAAVNAPNAMLVCTVEISAMSASNTFFNIPSNRYQSFESIATKSCSFRHFRNGYEQEKKKESHIHHSRPLWVWSRVEYRNPLFKLPSKFNQIFSQNFQELPISRLTLNHYELKNVPSVDWHVSFCIAEQLKTEHSRSMLAHRQKLNSNLAYPMKSNFVSPKFNSISAENKLQTIKSNNSCIFHFVPKTRKYQIELFI